MDRCGRPAASLVLGLTLVAGCGSQAPAPTAPDSLAGSADPAALAFRADEARIRGHLEALQAIADEHGGIRFSGTPGYEASVDYAAGVLRDIGFQVETPQVSYRGFAELQGGELTVGDRTFRAPDELHALIYSPGGEVTGPVITLDESGCDEEDFAGIEEGAIVVTVQGGCFRRQQAINAAEAGAAALLVGYPDRGPGEIFRPTLIEPDGISIPVVSVTGEAVRAIGRAEGERADLVIQTEREPASLRNVIAELGDGPRWIMLGAHLDSVLEGPGINDNGSGVAGLLEVARAAAEVGIPDGTGLRIGLWGGEELGTVGSRAYVEDMSDAPAAYLNLDMAGSVNGATLVYDEPRAAEGSAEISAAFERWFAARGEPSAPVDLGGSSDHFAFGAAGIPTGGLFAGATETGSAAQPGASATSGSAPDPCYHLACDDIGNVDLDRVALFAEAMLAVAFELVAGG
jgi:Zn-dependent M28 family amino/carboxypeptidase